MINLNLLEKLFKSSIIEYNEQYNYIAIEKTNQKIIIYNDKMISVLKQHAIVRKNCAIIKDYTRKHIYIHENYIKYIIRHKYLNTLIND